MRTIVITGGTDGMGAALARHYLLAGDRVTVVGRSRAKFDALVAGVARYSPTAGSKAGFIRADLSLVADNRRALTELTRKHDRVDALVLAASYIRRRRHVTGEGHEATWALFFLGKYLFVTGLAGHLAAADRPVIVNTAVPGTRPDAIDFDDLDLTSNFTFRRSNAQQRRANELLGIAATERNPALAYVTWGPSRLVRTSFAGDVGPATRFAATVLGSLLGQSPDDAVRPVIDLIDHPTPGRAAFRSGKRVALTATAADAEDATRLMSAAQASTSEPKTR